MTCLLWEGVLRCDLLFCWCLVCLCFVWSRFGWYRKCLNQRAQNLYILAAFFEQQENKQAHRKVKRRSSNHGRFCSLMILMMFGEKFSLLMHGLRELGVWGLFWKSWWFDGLSLVWWFVMSCYVRLWLLLTHFHVVFLLVYAFMGFDAWWFCFGEQLHVSHDGVFFLAFWNPWVLCQETSCHWTHWMECHKCWAKVVILYQPFPNCMDFIWFYGVSFGLKTYMERYACGWNIGWTARCSWKSSFTWQTSLMLGKHSGKRKQSSKTIQNQSN